MYCVKIEFGKEGPITREMFFMFQPNTAENQTVPERPGWDPSSYCHKVNRKEGSKLQYTDIDAMRTNVTTKYC